MAALALIRGSPGQTGRGMSLRKIASSRRRPRSSAKRRPSQTAEAVVPGLSASPTRRTVSKPASPQWSRRASKARRRSSSGRRPVTRTTESPTRIPLSTASRCHHRRSPMSSRDIRRAWMGFTLPARGRWLGPIGGTLVNRLAAAMPVWVNSIAARVPWAWIASTTRGFAGMSSSSERRPSTYGEASGERWIATSSVETTAHPPSALTPRIAASAEGSR